MPQRPAAMTAIYSSDVAAIVFSTEEDRIERAILIRVGVRFPSVNICIVFMCPEGNINCTQFAGSEVAF